MLPHQISGIYRQYKEDTNSVAAWLASAARTYGYTGPDDSVSQSTTQGSPGAGSSEEKVLGTDDEANVSNPWTSKPSKHIIHIEEFVPLAEYIASLQQPVVSVPPTFIITIDRLIRVRACFDYVQEPYSAESNQESDHEHGHFVRTMEAVKDALRFRMPNTTAQEKATTEASTDTPNEDLTDDLQMRFALLPIPIRSLVDEAPQRPRPRKEDTVEYETELKGGLEELMFTYLALVADLNRIRSRISWIWTHHRSGDFDHPAAAVATNVAISFARGIIEDASSVLETHPEGITNLVHCAFISVCARAGHSFEDVLRPANDQDHSDLYDLSRKTFHFAFETINRLVAKALPGVTTLIGENTLSAYHRDHDQDGKPGRKRIQDDEVLLLQIFNELMAVIGAVPNYPVRDEFMRSLHEAYSTKKPSLSLAFAAQIYLDIHHLMGQDIELTFRRWNSEIDSMISNLSFQIEFNKAVKAAEGVNPSLQGMINDIEWMRKDPVYDVKAKVYSNEGQTMPDVQPNRILFISPVISGMYLFQKRFMLREVGAWFVHDAAAVRDAAHLYNALDSANLLRHRWGDMDLIIELIGAERLWGGEQRPQTPEDSFNVYEAMKRKKPGSQSIGKGVPVSRIFETEITQGEELEWTAERIRNMVARSNEIAETRDGTFDVVQIINLEKLKKREKERQATREQDRKKKKKSKSSGGRAEATVDPDQCLRGLTIALQSETLELAFPYLALHRVCWHLLGLIKTKCDPILQEKYTSNYIPNNKMLPSLTGFILRESAGGVGSADPDRRALEAAAKTMEEYITVDERGGICIGVLQNKLRIDVGLWTGEKQGKEGGQGPDPVEDDVHEGYEENE